MVRRRSARGVVALTSTLLLISISIQSCIFLLLPAISSAIEVSFTPNPNDSVENGGSGGPLPASTQQRRQLLELEVTILNSQDPLATLDHVAKTNGLSREELTGMLDRNRRDLEESGQLEGMLGEMHEAMQSQGGGVAGAGGGGGQRRSMAESSLPRRLLSLICSIVLSLMKTASIHISRNPKQSTILATMLTCAFLAIHNAPRNGIVISSILPPFLSSGHTTLLEPPVDYLERYCLNSWMKGGDGWKCSLPEPKKVDVKPKSSKGKKKSTTQIIGGVGMTRSLRIDTSCAVEGEVTVETMRRGAKLMDGFTLITTAQTMIRPHRNEKTQRKNDKIDSEQQQQEIECMIESAKSILGERKFTEFVQGNSRSLKFRSIFVTATSDDGEEDEEAVIEGGVIAMKLLGDFRRYGVQPLCFSYETEEDDDGNEEDDRDPMTHCVAFHTLKGGHFDGELRFLVEEKENGGLVISVTLAIPDGGRVPTARLAEAMVSSIAHSIAQSTLIRTKQTLSRRMQSKTYRARASSRAVLKRHLQFDQLKAQEEMAAERKRKWKRNNPDAGHYRPSGHRLKSPNNC
ncbi:hypothetical protein ACHAXH_004537 [Discostella pseudostelligera]